VIVQWKEEEKKANLEDRFGNSFLVYHDKFYWCGVDSESLVERNSSRHVEGRA
jgi:hypothetical protein